MSLIPDLDLIRHELGEPFPSGRITPNALGQSLAHLVWESFSDFLSDPEYASRRAVLGLGDEADPSDHALEELLILHLWAHSRAVQLSFVDRIPTDTIRAILDELHRAVFEDMVVNGTPRAQVPVFEQRVSARYSEYHGAANRSDDAVGRVALEHMGSAGPMNRAAARVLRERAVEIARPLRDYLEGMDIADDG